MKKQIIKLIFLILVGIVFKFAFAEGFFILETGKIYPFTINFSSDEIITGGKIDIRGAVNSSTGCNFSNNSCSSNNNNFGYFNLDYSVNSSSFTGNINAKNPTSITTTLSFYVVNQFNQEKFIDSFSFIITSSIEASITSAVYYNTTTNKSITISGIVSSTTKFPFYKYATTATQTAYATLYITNASPTTDIVTTSADVRKIKEYAIFWKTSGMIENSCSLEFTDENITSNPTTLIFASSPTSSVVLVTTTPDFYHQHGKYQITCQTTYASCLIENSVLTCKSPIEDKVDTLLINKGVEWYRCFYGFCIAGNEKEGKTPAKKYTFPTFKDCAQKCYLDIKEIAP
jgi:predicted nucleic acid-binding Zn ribbon protein